MSKRELPVAELDSVDDFAARARLSRRSVYRAIKSGQIITVYIGNVMRIDPAPSMARIRTARSSSGPRRGRPRKGTASQIVCR
jgi:hypothetical protein